MIFQMHVPVGWRPPDERRLGGILALSLVVHALVLAYGGMRPPTSQDELPALMATIRLLPASLTRSVAETPSVSSETVQKVRQSSSRPAPSQPRPMTTAGPATAPAVAETPPMPVPVAVDTPKPVETVTARPTPSIDVLAGYRQQLSDLFARQHEYPRVAAMRGWEGEVRLRLKIARKGSLLSVQVEHSSGFDVLDQHALALLERQGTLPPFPEALSGNDIQVVVPILYKLRKATS